MTSTTTTTTTTTTATNTSASSLTPSRPESSNTPRRSITPTRVPSWSYPMVRPRIVHAGGLKAFTPHHELPSKAKAKGYQQLTEAEMKTFSREISGAARNTRANLENVPKEVGLENKFYDVSDQDIECWIAHDEQESQGDGSKGQSTQSQNLPTITGPQALMLPRE